MIDDHFEDSMTKRHRGTAKNFTKGGRSRVTIDNLPDVALLEIFDLRMEQKETWYRLVHVCRKWRYIVFGSPRRLDLRLYCTARTPVRKTLDVWPLLPIVIRFDGYLIWDIGNIIAALKHNDRICELDLGSVRSWQWEKVLAAIQQPFPALTRLRMTALDSLVVPALFLGGSAPHLQTLTLDHVPFSELSKLLLSATHLVHLYLLNIPDSGYISPEAMVTGFSASTRLECLIIEFNSPRSRPDPNSRRPPPPIRTILPILTKLWFKGVSEYLEDLVARIDAPLLNKLSITFFHQLIFDAPQLAQFINHTPKLKAHEEARVFFSDGEVSITLPQTFDGELRLAISCSQLDWQLSSLAHLCNSFFPQALIPAVEHFYIDELFLQRHWQDDIESTQWLELLRSFTAAKDLYISWGFVPRIAPTLQELIGERVTEVLPALQTLFLEEPVPSGSVQETIEKFVSARQLSSHPITVSHWERRGL